MKTEKELMDFYYSVLMPDINVLENERKEILKKFAMISVAAIGLIALLIVLKCWWWVPTLAALAWIGAYFLLTEDYVKKFKDKIIHKIIHFIDEGLNYIKEGFVPRANFLECCIFKHKPDRYAGDDFVSGRVGSTNIAFSEIHAEYVTGHGRNRTWHTIFKGLFFVGDFNKHFTGRTVVLPDTAERIFGHIGTLFQSWNVKRDDLVKLEDPEFEKFFAVYGTDQIQSRYILSTSLMKRITDFRKKTKRNMYLSFIGTKIFVAISYEKDLFEPNVFRTLRNFNAIQEYFNDLQVAIGISEHLNLNTRIWTKK